MPVFSISGELQKTQNYLDRDSWTQTTPFKIIIVGKNLWNLHYYVNNMYDYLELGCDGTNVYQIFVNENNLLVGFSAHVLPDCFPYLYDTENLIWFAYASGYYLKTNQLIPAVWCNPFLNPEAHIYDMKVKLSNNPPHLPESAIWIVSINKIKNLNNEFKKWPVTIQRVIDTRKKWTSNNFKPQEPFGFLAASYKVISFTNYNGYSLPLKFVLECFKYNPTNKSNTTSFVWLKYDGITKEICITNNINIYPKLPKDKIISIHDSRYKYKDGSMSSFNYFATNSWTNYDKTKVNYNYIREISLRENPKFKGSKIFYIFGLIIIVCILLLIWKTKR